MNRVTHVWVDLALFYRAFVATAIMLRGEEGYKDQEHEIKQQLKAFNWNGFFGWSTVSRSDWSSRVVTFETGTGNAPETEVYRTRVGFSLNTAYIASRFLPYH